MLVSYGIHSAHVLSTENHLSAFSQPEDTMKSLRAYIVLVVFVVSMPFLTITPQVDFALAADNQASVALIPTAVQQPRPSSQSTPVPVKPAYSYPIGTSGQPLGDGFFVRHSYVAENTWYNPGWWHTGEDWYAIAGDTAGAHVYAIADGSVVYVGANYPGRVVIVQHTPDLFSMYGHLDPALAVRVGQQVTRGESIGTVLRRSDKVPNHLHFEVRTFLTTRVVNGAAPRYRYRCGINCPPGPGYWPKRAPDHPGALGWRNPTHVIARRAFASGGLLGDVVVAANPVSSTVTLWSAPPGAGARASLGTLALRPSDHFVLSEVRAGSEDPRGTSALAYELWYCIRLPDGRSGWVQAAVPSLFETDAKKRPSSVRFNLFPAVESVP